MYAGWYPNKSAVCGYDPVCTSTSTLSWRVGAGDEVKSKSSCQGRLHGNVLVFLCNSRPSSHSVEGWARFFLCPTAVVRHQPYCCPLHRVLVLAAGQSWNKRVTVCMPGVNTAASQDTSNTTHNRTSSRDMLCSTEAVGAFSSAVTHTRTALMGTCMYTWFFFT